MRRAHQQHDSRVGDRMHNLFTVILPAEDAVTVTPDGDSFFLQQSGDVEHLLGILPRVADEDLRLSPDPGSFTDHVATPLQDAARARRPARMGLTPTSRSPKTA